jgi:N-acetylglucosamine kinase-like BadF-type ATPase
MEYFLGVDGGASSTICAICSDDGAVLGIGRGGPSNHILAPGGRDRARAALGESVRNALNACGLDGVAFRACYFGMTAINAGTESARVFAEVAGSVLAAGHIGIDNDAVVALAGALACHPGVIVISGTGSVAEGQDPSGRRTRAGGWGYIFGDEGSGFAIGLGAVRAALHARDGTGPETTLSEWIPGAISMSLPDIPIAFYEGRLERKEIAALAKITAAAAAVGDAVALALVRGAAESLADLAAAVIHRLSWPDQAVAVAPVGGIFTAGQTILGPFRRALAVRAPEAVLVPPRLTPAAGALLLAFRASDIPHTPERLALLAATWEMRSMNPRRWGSWPPAGPPPVV